MSINVSLFEQIADKVINNPSSRTTVHKFGKEVFTDNEQSFIAIEQNPATTSRWAVLAQTGHRVVQFINMKTSKYVAVSVDGKVTPYDSMQKTKNS